MDSHQATSLAKDNFYSHECRLIHMNNIYIYIQTDSLHHNVDPIKLNDSTLDINSIFSY